MCMDPRAAHRPTRSETLRAAQKDAFYCDSLAEQVQAALSALVVRPVQLRSSTVRAVTALTYLTLTTGRGIQTLGEEYCELTQVAATDGLPASALRRWFGLLVHVLLPYWSRRVEQRLVAVARRCEDGHRQLLQASRFARAWIPLRAFTRLLPTSGTRPAAAHPVQSV